MCYETKTIINPYECVCVCVFVYEYLQLAKWAYTVYTNVSVETHPLQNKLLWQNLSKVVIVSLRSLLFTFSFNFNYIVRSHFVFGYTSQWFSY